MVERLAERHDGLGLAECLDEERVVRPTGARVRNKANAALVQEVATVDGAPDAGVLFHHDGQVGQGHGTRGVGQAVRQHALLLVLRVRSVPIVHIDPRTLYNIHGDVHQRGTAEHALVHDRIDPVVRLDNRNPCAMGHLQAAITRGAVALVRLIDNDHTRIARLELAQNGEGAVLRAIV